MYSLSSKIDNLKTGTTNIVLRSTLKVKMKNYFTRKTRVYNGPPYRGFGTYPLKTSRKKRTKPLLKK